MSTSQNTRRSKGNSGDSFAGSSVPGIPPPSPRVQQRINGPEQRNQALLTQQSPGGSRVDARLQYVQAWDGQVRGAYPIYDDSGSSKASHGGSGARKRRHSPEKFDCPHKGCAMQGTYGFKSKGKLNEHISSFHKLDPKTKTGVCVGKKGKTRRDPQFRVSTEGTSLNQSQDTTRLDEREDRNRKAPPQYAPNDSRSGQEQTSMPEPMSAHVRYSHDEQPLLIASDVQLEAANIFNPLEAEDRIPRFPFKETTKEAITPQTTLGINVGELHAEPVSISWRCSCGLMIYDNFVELRPNAALTYETQLRQQSEAEMVQASNNGSQSNHRLSTMGNLLGSLTWWKTRRGPLLPQESQRCNTDNALETLPPSQVNNLPDTQALYLLLCVPYQKFATKLFQPCLTGVSSDKTFFTLLRMRYRHMRGRWKRLLSLKTIRGIKFVQFEVFKSELVNVQLENVVPPVTRIDEYHYRPAPPEVLPPIGENHMLHLFTHPDCAEDTGILLDRIPKKLKQPLEPCRVRGVGLGWGVHFLEGWHISIIIVLAFVVLLLASLVFVVCYSVLKHDVQSASGVAAYMVALVVLGIGSLQAGFELC